MDPTATSRLALRGRLPERRTGSFALRQTRRFLRGPIPWEWLCRASCLPGAALAVAVALWHLVGIKRAKTIGLGNALVTELGVQRHAKYRALAALESAGLVRVDRHTGRNPVVTLIDREAQP